MPSESSLVFRGQTDPAGEPVERDRCERKLSRTSPVRSHVAGGEDGGVGSLRDGRGGGKNGSGDGSEFST